MNSRAPISAFDRPSRANCAICVSWAVSSSRVSTLRFRAVSPVASSSRPARAANASAPIEVNISWAGAQPVAGVDPASAPSEAIRRREGEHEPARTPTECARGVRSPPGRAAQRPRRRSLVPSTVLPCRAPILCPPRVFVPTTIRSRRSRRHPGRSAPRPPPARATTTPTPSSHLGCRRFERMVGRPRSGRGRYRELPAHVRRR